MAESMVSIMGEGWLVGQINLPNIHDPIPADRQVMLVEFLWFCSGSFH